MNVQYARLFTISAGLSSLMLASQAGFAQPDGSAGRRIRTQPDPQMIRQELPAAGLQTQAFQELNRAPVSFQAFPMMDPKTRKPVAPTDKITLPDGRQVPAGEYYAQLNALEADLNKKGYSLKTKEKTLLVKQAVIDKQALAGQTSRISAMHKPGGGPGALRFQPPAANETMTTQLKRHVSAADAQAFGLDAGAFNTAITHVDTMRLPSAGSETIASGASSVLGAIQSKTLHIDPSKIIVINPGSKAIPVHEAYPFNWSVGSASTFQAYLHGKASIDGVAHKLSNPPTDAEMRSTSNHFTMHGDATAGGSVFGHGIDILAGNADFSADNTKVNAKLDISVLGHSVYNINESAPSKWEKSGTLSKGCDFHTSIDVPISFLTLTVKVGAHGEAGLKYGVSIYAPLAYVHGWVGPFVHTSVYAQAGIGVGGSWLGVSAGVGASMTLLNYDMDVDAQVGLLWFINYGLFEKLDIHNKLDMLSGRVYAFAEFNHPCFPDFWNGCSNQISVDLWNWSGFHTEGDLLAFNNSHPL